MTNHNRDFYSEQLLEMEGNSIHDSFYDLMDDLIIGNAPESIRENEDDDNIESDYYEAEFPQAVSAYLQNIFPNIEIRNTNEGITIVWHKVDGE